MPQRNLGLVTGASRGIGRAVTEDLISRGWSVGALARDEAALTDLASQYPAGRLHKLVADVTDPAAVARCVAALRVAGGTPDLIVANAGTLTAVGASWEVEHDRWWRELEVNVLGVMATLHASIPALVERGSGRIVVTSSGLGKH